MKHMILGVGLLLAQWFPNFGFAFGDAVDGAIDYNTYNSGFSTNWCAASTTDKPFRFQNRTYNATGNLDEMDPVHCKTSARYLIHFHCEAEYGATFYFSGVGWLNAPSAAEGNRYWDIRFSKPYNETATMKRKECFEWALSNSSAVPAGSKYEYHLDPDESVSPPFSDDLESLGVNSTAVQSGDILHYGSHVTLVEGTRSNGAGGWEPSALAWKWSNSGIYRISNTPNGEEYSNPYCAGAENEDATMPNQGWVGTNLINPTVYSMIE